ncbi:MAG: Holliday junction resolvase RuvX, partial [Pseudomonadota bacterium]
MILEEIAEFATALPSARPIVGLDLGTKTIGVALS